MEYRSNSTNQNSSLNMPRMFVVISTILDHSRFPGWLSFTCILSRLLKVALGQTGSPLPDTMD